MERSELGQIRIGELSQRVGVSPELLRAWERRYRLLRPSRSTGGFRLYSAADEARVRRMKTLIADGLAAAEAARLATAPFEQPPPQSTLPIENRRRELSAALDAFDDEGAHRSLDLALATYSLEQVLGEIVLPYLADLGDRWAEGEASVAQEHFASNLLRGRLLSIARAWHEGLGPRVILACPEGELHDIGLIAFGLILNRRGWRITFLGADTPGDTLLAAAQELQPEALVIAASEPNFLQAAAADLSELSRRFRVVLAGQGPDDDIAARIGAEVTRQNPVAAAEQLAGSLSV